MWRFFPRADVQKHRVESAAVGLVLKCYLRGSLDSLSCCCMTICFGPLFARFNVLCSKVCYLGTRVIVCCRRARSWRRLPQTLSDLLCFRIFPLQHRLAKRASQGPFAFLFSFNRCFFSRLGWSANLSPINSRAGCLPLHRTRPFHLRHQRLFHTDCWQLFASAWT